MKIFFIITTLLLSSCSNIQFGWDEDSFWNLESTQKIRLCCQKARQMQYINDKPKLSKKVFK